MKVLGIQKGKSKKGNDYCILHLSDAMPAEYGIGERVSTEFIDPQLNLKDVKVGSEIQFCYGRGSNGRAYVADVVVVH